MRTLRTGIWKRISKLLKKPASGTDGFTLLEMIIVMFLLVAMLGIVIPRIDLSDDLGSTGRKFIGSVRTLQGIAMSTQKPVKLYLDLDQGQYWAMTIEGKEEKPLPDAAWAMPRLFPETIRLTDASSGSIKRTCLLYTSPSPRDRTRSRMPSSA